MYADVLEVFQEQARHLRVLGPATEQPAVVLDRRHERQHRVGGVADCVLLDALQRLLALGPLDDRVRARPSRLTDDLVLLVGGKRFCCVENVHRQRFYWGICVCVFVAFKEREMEMHLRLQNWRRVMAGAVLFVRLGRWVVVCTDDKTVEGLRVLRNFDSKWRGLVPFPVDWTGISSF